MWSKRVSQNCGQKSQMWRVHSSTEGYAPFYFRTLSTALVFPTSIWRLEGQDIDLHKWNKLLSNFPVAIFWSFNFIYLMVIVTVTVHRDLFSCHVIKNSILTGDLLKMNCNWIMLLKVVRWVETLIALSVYCFICRVIWNNCFRMAVCEELVLAKWGGRCFCNSLNCLWQQ